MENDEGLNQVRRLEDDEGLNQVRRLEDDEGLNQVRRLEDDERLNHLLQLCVEDNEKMKTLRYEDLIDIGLLMDIKLNELALTMEALDREYAEMVEEDALTLLAEGLLDGEGKMLPETMVSGASDVIITAAAKEPMVSGDSDVIIAAAAKEEEEEKEKNVGSGETRPNN